MGEDGAGERPGVDVVVVAAGASTRMGGIDKLGAVIGGVTVGVLENVAASYVSAGYRDTFVFSFTILVLLIRPQGLFGVRTFQRV